MASFPGALQSRRSVPNPARVELVAMTMEEERLAEALAVDKLYGPGAPVFVAERIGALALDGDVDGINRWKAIAQRLEGIIAARAKLAS